MLQFNPISWMCDFNEHRLVACYLWQIQSQYFQSNITHKSIIPITLHVKYNLQNMQIHKHSLPKFYSYQRFMTTYLLDRYWTHTHSCWYVIFDIPIIAGMLSLTIAVGTNITYDQITTNMWQSVFSCEDYRFH